MAMTMSTLRGPVACLRPFAAAAVAVGVNSLSLGFLTRRGEYAHSSTRGRLLLHSAVILPGWLWFATEARALEQHSPHGYGPRSSAVVGWSVQAAGFGLVAAGFRVLGPGAIINADLFLGTSPPRSREGVYRLFSQPIYAGYSLAVMGQGLSRRNATLVALGVWLAILLLVVQAPTEDLVFDRRRRAG